MFERLLSKPTTQSFLLFLQKYERYLAITALIGGFVFDALTLTRPGALLGNIILGGYLLISAGSIVALSLYRKKQTVAPILLLFLLQFSFGNLAGGLLVLYGKSGTFEGSLLFFLVFGAFIIGNEFLRKRYVQLVFHVGAWFFLALAYSALIVPVVVRQMGDGIFLGSVVVSLLAVSIILLLVFTLSPTSVYGFKKQLSFVVMGLSLFFVGLYYANVIPPVPLSLQQIGIFHAVAKIPNGYEATFESPLWFEFFRDTSRVFVLENGGAAFCFSAIFAPAGLTTPVHHHWEKYDETTGEWRTRNIISFVITGGRESGYRGYSEKSGLQSGRWRCSVETRRGALIGRTTFEVREGMPTLSRVVL